MATMSVYEQPDYCCEEQQKMVKEMQICRHLMGGTPEMRKQGRLYLPQEPDESDSDWNVRLNRSVLFGNFGKTVETLTAAPFKTPPVYTEMPPMLSEHVEDINMAGDHLNEFARRVFMDAIIDGHAFMFIDQPTQLDTSITSAALEPDLSDTIAAGHRPFWVSYTKDQAINWFPARIDGETVIQQITFQECIAKREGRFGAAPATRYRVLFLPELKAASKGKPAVYGPMQWELWEKKAKAVRGNPWELVEDGETELSRVPLVTVYTGKTGFLTSRPPLLNLGYLNASHWQVLSDQFEMIRYLMPFTLRKFQTVQDRDATDKAVKTVDGRKQLRIGPKAIVDQIGKDTGMELKAHSPDAVKPVRDLVKDLEAQMSVEGISLAADNKDRQITATEKSMDQAERMAGLSAWVQSMVDSMEQGLRIHARMIGAKDGGSVTMNVAAIRAEDIMPPPAPMMPPEMDERAGQVM